MKLRQKLAVVMAAAMVASAVPVVTMASSTNTLLRETMKVKKDNEKFADVTTSNALLVTFTGHQTGDEVFYLEVENAKFADNVYKTADSIAITGATGRNSVRYVDTRYGAGIAVTMVSNDNLLSAAGSDVLASNEVQLIKCDDKTVKVIVPDALAQASKGENRPVTIPLLAEAESGEMTVTVNSMGGQSTVSSGTKLVFATTSEKIFSQSVGDKTTFYTDNNSKLADLTLEESYKGALSADSDGTIIKLEINDTDFNFYGYPEVNKKDDVAGLTDPKADLIANGQAERKYGFANKSVTVKAAMDKKDNGILYVYINGSGITQDSIGKIILKGLRVDCLVKDPDEGDFKVDVKGDDLTNEADNVVMGEVVKFGNTIKMKDEKVVDVVGGRIKEIQFDVAEAVENTMISEREFEVKLDENAHFDYKGLVKDFAESDHADAADFKADYFDDFDKLDIKEVTGDDDEDDDDWKKAAAHINKTWLADKVLDNYKKDNTGDWKDCYVEFDKDSDGLAIVDTLIVTVGYPKEHADISGHVNYQDPAQNNDHKDKLTFKLKVCVPVDKKDNEKVVVSASGRALENETYSTTAINIVNPFKVESTECTLKTGLKEQTSTCSIKLTETDKEMFQTGQIKIAIKDQADSGMKITGATFKVDGELKRVKTEKKDGYVTFDLKRDSNSAATVEVTELEFTTDRTVPEGTYDIEISGSAICQETKDYGKGHKITIKDVIKIGTPNTEDITAGGLKKGTTTFVIGESKYTSNGVEVAMDAPSYIQDPGYTMVPVRYVAQAFGVEEKNIIFGNGTVTIFAGERTLSLTNGSDVAVVNGNTITMGTKVVIKDGRTYAPAGEIARLLGIQTAWDAATKTATFTN